MKQLAYLLFAAISASAQTPPQLVWEGEVDGTAVVHVRGSRLDVEDRQGAPVSRDRHRFSERLPDFDQRAEVQLLDGRGQWRILQQPNSRNNFTLSVLIEDRQAGRDLYRLAFYWSSSSRGGFVQPPRTSDSGFRGGRQPGRGEEKLMWSGQVDDEVIVECRGNDCRAQNVRGLPVRGDRFLFSRPIPNSELRMSLDEVQGRGDVRMMEQPGPHNGYTAKILIRDAQGGSGDYSFALFWSPPARSGPDRLFARPGFTWYGRVDGTVRVMVQDSSAVSDVVNGAPVTGERVNFMRPLERANMLNLQAKKVKGRGRVDVAEFPSSRNGWRLVFEVSDNSGGADDYEIAVGW